MPEELIENPEPSPVLGLADRGGERSSCDEMERPDADGNAAGFAGVHFATLSGHPTITNADFVVI